MHKQNLVYFAEEDVIHLSIAAGKESASAELSPNVTAELNEDGEIIGVEILNASAYLRNSILDSAQARLLTAPLRRPTPAIRTKRRPAPQRSARI